MGFPTGMETHGSDLPVIRGLHGSGFSFWVLQVHATSTHETNILFIYFTNLNDYHITHFDVLLSGEHKVGVGSFLSPHRLC